MPGARPAFPSASPIADLFGATPWESSISPAATDFVVSMERRLKELREYVHACNLCPFKFLYPFRVQ